MSLQNTRPVTSLLHHNIPFKPLRMLKTYPFSKQNTIFSKILSYRVIERNSLDHNIRKVGSFSVFKNNFLKFIRPTTISVFSCENHRGIKLITRLRVDLSYLREHKFKHSFQDTLNPILSCRFDIALTSHYVLCPIHNYGSHTLLSTIKPFYLEIVLLMNTLIYRFLMQPLNISSQLKDLISLCFNFNKKILLIFRSFI